MDRDTKGETANPGARRDAPETLMIAGGGTGGHVYPAIAIAREFVSRDRSRRVVFVGTARGLEQRIVPAAGFPLEILDVGGLKGKSAPAILRNLLRLPGSFVGAWRIISRYRPVVALGVGGYASGPVLVAAALRGIPTLIQEQNAFPGITNRILARFVKEVAVAFPEALTRLRREGSVTGNPVRREFFEMRSEPSASGPVRLLIFGGSQGSRVLNDAMSSALFFLATLKGKLEIVHQTGTADVERVREAYRTSPFPEATVVPYLDEMAREMARATLVVSRAGAITLGELAAIGRGAILVPFALASDNHQEVNARAVEATGGAIVVTEKDLTGEKLAGAIIRLTEDQARLVDMGKRFHALAAAEAAAKIVDIVERISKD